jgi:hypothetical protein
MLSDRIEETTIGMEFTPSWAPAERRPQSEPRWRVVDRALRDIAVRRAALDADEAQWLREAEALQIWRQLGMVSALDYLERVLGYAPRTAQDRLRVARALGALPELTAALAVGKLSHSAVRELTRVATPATEAAWIAAATGKNLRQIEELVADHRPGDRPDDPPDPEARMHVVRFELAAEAFALLRQARTVLDDEHGHNLPDNAFVTALCNAVLDGTPASEPTGRAKFQIAVTVCERCGLGWQEGAGAQIAIDNAAVERAMCDAQHIGSIDGSAPERAHQDIPPSVVRLVWRRDGGRCRVDGCRSSRGLEVHHIVHRADGGNHDPLNLATLCSSCHLAHHRGALSISGTADRLEIHRPGQPACTPDSGSSTRTTSTTPRVSVHVGAASETTVEPQRAHVDAASKDTVEPRRTHVNATTMTASIDGAALRAGTARGATSAANARAPMLAASKLDAAILRTQAKAALVGLGWKPAIAHEAIAAAAAVHGADLTLERLIFESLRRCPTPKA